MVIAAIAGIQHDHRLTVRSGHQVGMDSQFIWALPGVLTIEMEHLTCSCHRMDHASSEHPDQRVQLERKCSDDAKVTTASAHGPEEVWVFGRACHKQIPISRDDLDREQVVDGQAVSAREPAIAATQGEASEANMAHDPWRSCQDKLLSCTQELCIGQTWLGTCNALLRVNVNALHL